jgi:hypothetical protein
MAHSCVVRYQELNAVNASQCIGISRAEPLAS